MLGIKDLNFEIMYRLDDESLGNLCQTDKKAKALCDNDMFWRNRIEKLYGEKVLSEKKEGEKWKDFYISSQKIKDINLCRKLRDLPHSSQLVIDDFYNPVTGYINHRSTIDQNGITYVILKITLNKMEEKSIINFEETNKLKSLIDNLVPELEGRTFSLDTYKFTRQDYETFIDIVNLPNLTRRQLFDNMKPEIKKSFYSSSQPSKNVLTYFPIILHIHRLFYERVLPPDVTWDEVCKYI